MGTLLLSLEAPNAAQNKFIVISSKILARELSMSSGEGEGVGGG